MQIIVQKNEFLKKNVERFANIKYFSYLCSRVRKPRYQMPRGGIKCTVAFAFPTANTSLVCLGDPIRNETI